MANWLERAKLEISKTAGGGTANTVERTLTSVTAVGKAEPEYSPTDPTEGRIVAVLIASEVLGADIWFALDESFDTVDGLAVFYPDELEFLKSKDAQTLRKIHETKLAFGPASRVRQ